MDDTQAGILAAIAAELHAAAKGEARLEPTTEDSFEPSQFGQLDRPIQRELKI